MNLQTRIRKLEYKHGTPEKKIYIVIYDKDTGRATGASSKELFGMTREEITAQFDNENTTFVNVVPASTLVFIPDNHRGEL